MNNIKNLNNLWANAIVDCLVLHGIDSYYMSPGSRNTPFLYAIHHHPQANFSMHIDERALAFRALGYAKATGKPAVICVTSGTALANLYPALLEAHHTNTSLIVISGDRSFREQYNNNNQSMNQHHLYHSEIAKYVYIPAPTLDTPIHHALSISSHVASLALRTTSPAIVHLNVSLSKPLEPHTSTDIPTDYITPYLEWKKTKRPYTQFTPPIMTAPADIELPSDCLFLIAQMHPKKAQAIAKLLNDAKLPFYSELETNIQSQTSTQLRHLTLYIDQVSPKHVIHLGSKIVNDDLMAALSVYPTTLVHPHHRTDIFNTLSHYIACDELLYIQALLDHNTVTSSTPKKWLECEQSVATTLSELLNKDYNEIPVLRRALSSLPTDSVCFIANSLPIRQYTKYLSKDTATDIYCNRGVSGIDGNIATFCGVSESYSGHRLLLIGDVSCLHDLHSLSMVSSMPRTTVIVINNSGGAIFKYLPISKTDEATFESAFFTPHHLDNFASIAQTYSLNYHTISNAKDIDSLDAIISQTSSDSSPALVEVIVNADDTLAIERTLAQQVLERLS